MKLHSKSFFESILKLTIFEIINNFYALFNAKFSLKCGMLGLYTVLLILTKANFWPVLILMTCL